MSKPIPHNPVAVLEAAVFGDRKDHVAVTDDGRNKKGRFVKGHVPSPELLEKRMKTLTSRVKGQSQTPNMNFSGKINWLNRILSQFQPGGYIAQNLKKHPARENLFPRDELKLRSFEARALELQRLANHLQVEIAAWNKGKNMRKMVE